MTSSTCTRISLLERLREGTDPMAWEDFFRCYWPFIFSIARQRGCSEHTSEEIVQEVMLAIFERKAVFCHDRSLGRFRDWLGAVVRNKVAARRRGPGERRWKSYAQGCCPPGSQAIADDQWEMAFDQAMLAFLLDIVRAEVNPRTYQAFEAFTLGGCSGREAARLTGLTRNAVYQARKNILRRLRELGVEFGEPGPPDEMVLATLLSRPSAAIERSLVTQTKRAERMSAGESNTSPLSLGEG